MDGFVGNDETVNISSSEQSAANEDIPGAGRYAEDYNPEDVACILRNSNTAFETLKEDQNKAGFGENPWAPFDDEEEWELAQFLMKEVSQTAIDKYLKLKIVSEGLVVKRQLN